MRNAEKFLPTCLRSILTQSYRIWQLIAVDDHSSDQTLKIARGFEASDDRIKCVGNSGTGIIDAIKFGFEQAEGAWITRMDADDLMPEDKLKNLVQLAEQKRVVTGRVEYFSSAELSSGYIRYEQWLNALAINVNHYDHRFRECVVASPNWLISRKFFDDFDWKNWKYPEDYDLIFHWHQAGYEIVPCSAVTHLWREHPERTSRNSSVYAQESFFRLKTNWFMTSVVKPGEFIQIVGTGTKSRLIRKLIKSYQNPYRLFELNQLKGAEKIADLRPEFHTILGVWPLGEAVQKEITQWFEERNFVFGGNLWLF